MIFVLGVVVAPAAFAVTGNKQHPSSDAPWFIGALVLVLLALGGVFALTRRRVSKTHGSDFQR